MQRRPASAATEHDELGRPLVKLAIDGSSWYDRATSAEPEHRQRPHDQENLCLAIEEFSDKRR